MGVREHDPPDGQLEPSAISTMRVARPGRLASTSVKPSSSRTKYELMGSRPTRRNRSGISRISFIDLVFRFSTSPFGLRALLGSGF